VIISPPSLPSLPSLPSFPGSAWERAVLEAPPPGSCSVFPGVPACSRLFQRPGWCSSAPYDVRQAEPAVQCVPRQEPGNETTRHSASLRAPRYTLVPRLCLGTGCLGGSASREVQRIPRCSSVLPCVPASRLVQLRAVRRSAGGACGAVRSQAGAWERDNETLCVSASLRAPRYTLVPRLCLVTGCLGGSASRELQRIPRCSSVLPCVPASRLVQLRAVRRRSAGGACGAVRSQAGAWERDNETLCVSASATLHTRSQALPGNGLSWRLRLPGGAACSRLFQRPGWCSAAPYDVRQAEPAVQCVPRQEPGNENNENSRSLGTRTAGAWEREQPTRRRRNRFNKPSRIIHDKSGNSTWRSASITPVMK
jgi:hypothetical protein